MDSDQGDIDHDHDRGARALIMRAMITQTCAALSSLPEEAEKVEMLQFFRDELRRLKLASPAPPGGDVPQGNRAQRRAASRRLVVVRGGQIEH